MRVSPLIESFNKPWDDLSDYHSMRKRVKRSIEVTKPSSVYIPLPCKRVNRHRDSVLLSVKTDSRHNLRTSVIFEEANSISYVAHIREPNGRRVLSGEGGIQVARLCVLTSSSMAGKRLLKESMQGLLDGAWYQRFHRVLLLHSASGKLLHNSVYVSTGRICVFDPTLDSILLQLGHFAANKYREQPSEAEAKKVVEH